MQSGVPDPSCKRQHSQMASARGRIEYDVAGSTERKTLSSAPPKAAADFAYQLPKNDDLYIFPPPCTEPSCLNYNGRTTPVETYYLCGLCRSPKKAPDAYLAGYARLPQLWPKMKKREREDWRRKTNANVLAVKLGIKRRANLCTLPRL